MLLDPWILLHLLRMLPNIASLSFRNLDVLRPATHDEVFTSPLQRVHVESLYRVGAHPEPSREYAKCMLLGCFSNIDELRVSVGDVEGGDRGDFDVAAIPKLQHIGSLILEMIHTGAGTLMYYLANTPAVQSTRSLAIEQVYLDTRDLSMQPRLHELILPLVARVQRLQVRLDSYWMCGREYQNLDPVIKLTVTSVGYAIQTMGIMLAYHVKELFVELEFAMDDCDRFNQRLIERMAESFGLINLNRTNHPALEHIEVKFTTDHRGDHMSIPHVPDLGVGSANPLDATLVAIVRNCSLQRITFDCRAFGPHAAEGQRSAMRMFPRLHENGWLRFRQR